MKKNIVIVILILVSATLVIYSYIKAKEAEKAAQEVQLTIQAAERHSKEAVQFQERALHAAADAYKQKKESERLMSELQKCQSK